MKLTLLLTATAALAALSNAADDFNGTDTTRRLAGSGMYRVRGIDLVGNDFGSVQYASLGACMLGCLTRAVNSGALIGYGVAVTRTSYNGGTCWCKGSTGQAPLTAPNADADSLYYETSSDAIRWFTKIGEFDMPGNDLTSTKGADISVCRTDCARNDQCYAAVWTNHEGGTCWLKSRASAYVPKTGSRSVFLARKISSLADA